MNIIFQRGEFYFENGQQWTDFLKDIVLPIATLLLGYWLSTWNEKRKERRRLRQLIELLRFETEVLPNQLRLQRESFDEFSRGLQTGIVSTFGINIIHNLVGIDRKFGKYPTLDVLEGLYGIHAKKNHSEIRKRVYSLFEGVRLVERVISEVEILKVNGVTKVNGFKGEVSTIIQNLADEIRGYSDVVKENPSINQDFLREAVSILNNHLETASQFKIIYGRESFILPLTSAAERYSNECKYAKGMLKQLYICANLFKRIDTEISALVGNVQELSSGLKHCEESIEAALEIFSKEKNTGVLGEASEKTKEMGSNH